MIFQHWSNGFNWLPLAEWLFGKFRILTQKQMKFLISIECQSHWTFCWFNSKFKVAKKKDAQTAFIHCTTGPILSRGHIWDLRTYVSIIHEMFFYVSSLGLTKSYFIKGS